MSPRRCLVLTRHEIEGWRLWQIVQKQVILADAIRQTLAETDGVVLATKLSRHLRVLTYAAEKFANVVAYFPFTLSTISADEAVTCFTGILPAPAARPRHRNRRPMIW